MQHHRGIIILGLTLFGLMACGTTATSPESTDTQTSDTTTTNSETPDESPAVECSEAPEGEVSLPLDEGVHDEDIEWWYWTGHLQAEDGRWFGFEQVFFLIQNGDMTFTMAHHAITDATNQKFNYDVKFGMWDGVTAERGFAFTQGPLSAHGYEGIDVLHGELDNSTMDVELKAIKGPVLQHENGYHDYPFGGFTYYYSRERMEAMGTLVLNGETIPVTGTAWFDHQWGALGNATGAGWDWFAIQLDDNREVMATVIHDDQGPLMYAGSITDEKCSTKDLQEEDIQITPLGEWTSPATGCTYPLGWELVVDGLNLTVTPVMAEQEIASPEKTYWEGAATVSGDATGRAYIELVGYCP